MVGHIAVKTLYTNNYIEHRIQNLPQFCLNFALMCKTPKYLAKFVELCFELYYKNTQIFSDFIWKFSFV